eukprot:3612055-Rhodomonas_salina.1
MIKFNLMVTLNELAGSWSMPREEPERCCVAAGMVPKGGDQGVPPSLLSSVPPASSSLSGGTPIH